MPLHAALHFALTPSTLQRCPTTIHATVATKNIRALGSTTPPLAGRSSEGTPSPPKTAAFAGTDPSAPSPECRPLRHPRRRCLRRGPACAKFAPAPAYRTSFRWLPTRGGRGLRQCSRETPEVPHAALRGWPCVGGREGGADAMSLNLQYSLPFIRALV